MGLFDKLTKVLGGGKAAQSETIKGPSATLMDHGIDPSGLKFSFNQDTSITVSGHAADQSACDRICEVIGDMPNVSGVKNDIIVGAPEPVAVPEPEPEVIVAETSEPEVAVAETIDQAEEAAAPEDKESGRTYTVESGDTLWAIAEKMYGSGGKYMKIFEANTTLLDSPDKIFPGQELVIPDLEES